MEAFDLCVDQVLDAVLNLSKKEETKRQILIKSPTMH